MSGSPVRYGPVPAEFHAPGWAYVVCAVASLMLYAAVIKFGLTGNWLVAGLLALVASYGIMALTRSVIGPVTIAEAFNPKTQSWAMLCDLFLVFAIMLASYEYPKIDPQWHVFSGATAWAYVAGLIVGVGWHFALDMPKYDQQGGAALMFEPAKLGHDLVVWTVLAGSLFRLVMPILISAPWSRSLVPWLVATCLAVYVLVGMGHDMFVKLDVFKIHCAFNYKTMRPDPSYRMPRQLG